VDVEEENAPVKHGVLFASAIARDQISVKFSYPIEKSAKLEIYSPDGRLVKSMSFTAGPNASEISIPTVGMSNGVYLMRITAGNTEVTQKVTVIK